MDKKKIIAWAKAAGLPELPDTDGDGIPDEAE